VDVSSRHPNVGIEKRGTYKRKREKRQKLKRMLKIK
jgi:hypothetical protein